MKTSGIKNDFPNPSDQVVGDLDKNLSAVYVNPQQPAQVFLNVLANAREGLGSREHD
jgi:nitrogen-specific signal transduction histidine kinase